MIASAFRHIHLLRGLHPIFVVALAGLWVLFPAAMGSAAQRTLHHSLDVEIINDTKILRGIDTIHFPRGASRLRVAFRPGMRILSVAGATHTQREGVLHLNLDTADLSSKAVVLRYEGFGALSQAEIGFGLSPLL